ncbi:hypothetical protein ISF6_1484 [Piscinibacter sakaiensis]|uniref:DUF218 domain-containing protein n=1 Tax=Piscinibacter sakaiensis TaxID=1547922 RepID=A0A0K8NZA6_PISS1|nr:hypothetical protein ISF6_1484 [Piscinibacter sakaiensis]
MLTALVLPPVPMLAVVLAGWLLAPRHRRTGRLLVLGGLAALWFSTTSAGAQALLAVAGLQPPALQAPRVAALRAQAQARSTAAPPRTAIVVLGGGRERLAPEYGQAMLGADSLQRLHYGVWLARATGLPLAFSGGRGWAQLDGEAEADLAARIAAQDYGLPLRWRENQSRDTRENARLTVALLRAEGVERILLVTHGWHMARARRAFEAEAGGTLAIEPAPMGLAAPDERPPLAWLPSGGGSQRFRQAAREWLAARLGH